jgi:hypothetical protein
MLPDVDLVHDLREPLPFEDGSVHKVLADNILEHLPVPFNIQLINEISRVLVSGGTAEIIVPHAQKGQGAFQDMSHCSYYVPRCALYWASPEHGGTVYGKLAGFTSDLITEKIEEYGNTNEWYIRFRLKRA